jgi:hypothetical protein
MGFPPSFFADDGQVSPFEFVKIILDGWCLHMCFFRGGVACGILLCGESEPVNLP